ncbi:Mss4-like protein [Neoconidiobolus thromboides FSU 785]|nr:Mss4-like protein [Neoconidiobolus thromboides FSU 785]
MPETTYAITENNKNGNKLRCIEPSCNSLILRKNKAELVDNVELPEDYPEKSSTECWKIADVFDFDNISYSKLYKDKLKFLACADCEKGPLGYQIVGEKHSYLFTNKVKYDE